MTKGTFSSLLKDKQVVREIITEKKKKRTFESLKKKEDRQKKIDERNERLGTESYTNRFKGE